MTGVKVCGARTGLAPREFDSGFETSAPRLGATLGRPVTQGSGLGGASSESAELLSLSFDAITMEAAVARCLEFCRAPRASHVVVTANASHLCMIRNNPELALACRAAHLTVADGMSVVWALRASGQPAPERVAGVDLMDRLLAAAGNEGLRVYFLGARREVVESSGKKEPRAVFRPRDCWLPRRLFRA